jgi:hypothetical protein
MDYMRLAHVLRRNMKSNDLSDVPRRVLRITVHFLPFDFAG